jgi:hypothetical protein
MQISTARVVTVTQVILNQDELKEAVLAFIKAKVELAAAPDAKIDVEFADDDKGDLAGFIDITSTAGDLPAEKPAPTTKPASKPRSTKPIPAPAPLPAATIEAAPEPEVKDEPPFDVDPPKPETAPVQEPAKAKPVTATTKIFPDVSTSAPPPPPAAEVDPTVKAKSLFANLGKPN